MTFRKVIFWLHLVLGVVAGAVIGIMSITGVAIAFEEEILAWIDRDVSRIEIRRAETPKLTLAELGEKARALDSAFVVTSITIPRDPARAYELYAGREGPLYADPHTGDLRASRSHAAHEIIHALEEWHRWLGMSGSALPVGKFITGVCNLAFLGLCLTGLYLWFPRRWSWRALKPQLWFAARVGGKARDFNWHNVIGFWSLPGLIVLAFTAVVISFAWAHRLVFTVTGETAPIARNFGMMRVEPPIVPTPAAGARRLPIEQIVPRIAAHVPDWETIGVNLPAPAADDAALVPLAFDVMRDDTMPSRAYVPVKVDPFTGEILQTVRFADRSAGLRARVWIRFLHTGGAFGVTGKIVATFFTLASLVLVYTGFALWVRRVLAWNKRRTSSATR